MKMIIINLSNKNLEQAMETDKRLKIVVEYRCYNFAF